MLIIKKLKVRVAMGLEVFRRSFGNCAPSSCLYAKAGLEWLYRLVTQPSRFKRMSVLPIFLIKVVMERLFFKKGY